MCDQLSKFASKAQKLSNNRYSYDQQLGSLYNKINITLSDSEKITKLLHSEENFTRPRRSVLPFVGQISKIQFRTLDEKSEIALRRLIDNHKNSTHQLASLLANQTEIIDSELNTFRAHFEDFNQSISHLETAQREDETNSIILDSTSSLSELCMQYKLDTETLTDAILFAA